MACRCLLLVKLRCCRYHTMIDYAHTKDSMLTRPIEACTRWTVSVGWWLRWAGDKVAEKASRYRILAPFLGLKAETTRLGTRRLAECIVLMLVRRS